MALFKTRLFPSGISQSEKFTSILWYYIWGYAFFGELLSTLSVRILPSESFHIANIIVTLILVFPSLPFIIKKVRVFDIIIWSSYFLFILISIILYTNNNYIQEEYAIDTLLIVSPYLFIGLCIKMDFMRKPMGKISFMVILWYIFYCMFYQKSKIGSMGEQGAYESMHFAYLVLPHVLFCICNAFRGRDFMSIIGSVSGTFLLLSFGNRGSLVDLAFFILSYLLIFFKGKRKYIVYAVATATFIVIYIFLDEIIIFFQGIMYELGMSTRIFDVLTENSFLSGASVDERDSFTNILSTAIQNGPLLGYGFCGSWQFIGSYPHNLYYDLFITFGPVCGAIILIGILILIYKAFKSANTIDEKAFLLVLVTTGFFKLLISYTFINNVETFLMIGYCLNLIRTRCQSVKTVCLL